MKHLVPIVATVALVIACGGKKKEAAPQTGSDTTAPVADAAGSATAAATPDPAAVEDVDVPTEMDFEADATDSITEATVEAELTALEKELAE